MNWLARSFFWLGLSFACSLRADPGPMVLWYTNAAVNWQQEALPVGNGKLAAMIFGGTDSEQIQFNEDTIWTGQPHDYGNLNATPAHLASIQSQVFLGQDSWSETSVYLMSQPLRQCSYQPAGSLWLNFSHTGATNYKRSLDLNTATANVTYTTNGITFTREVFASAPGHKVIVVRLTASQPGKISFNCQFTTPHTNNTVFTNGADLVLHASVTVQAPSYTLASVIQFEARVRVIAQGGSVTSTNGTTLSVVAADSVTLLLGVASSFVNFQDVSGDPASTCSNLMTAAATNTYAQLRQAHLDDYQPLFQRVVLDLGATSKTNLPTGQRIKRVGEGDDPQLAALYFQMARYLMISGSRPGSQPLTLQGKWNNVTNPSWESKMTLNINEEMNYWAAESCNLSECHAPLFDLIQDLSVTGHRVAGTNYNCDGWVVHHNTDLWRGAAPINGRDGTWPTGGAWLCQHLWWHYEYTGDAAFLANTAYPLMKGAAQFFSGFLVPHPTNSNWLVTNPSFSPEHDHPVFNVANVAGPTMDNELIRDLLNNVIQASQILGVDGALRTNLVLLRDRLPPDQIGQFGQLQEWLEDVDEVGDTHRHCSHLVGLYPGDAISPFYTPALAAAAKVSVDWRGLGDIGWGKSWRIGLNDRLLNSARAYQILTNLVSRDVSTNMMFTDVNNRQMDAIFGALAGVTEMLLQSQSGEIHLLPALPGKWAAGSVSGLCARGGFRVGLQWQNNKLTSANVLSRLGHTCRIRSKWPITVKRGTNDVNAPMIQPGLWEFSTLTGSNYTIVPANSFETELLPITTSGGDTQQTVTNLAFSNSRGVRLNANAPGDFVSFTLTNLPAGTYRVRVVADAQPNGGQFQLSVGPSGGVLTNLGGVYDTWSATQLIYLLATNSPPTNYFSTNLLTEFNCGTWVAGSNGACRFTVVDKNAGSGGYALTFDYLKFTPVPPPAPIELWRAAKFGSDANNPAIAGDNADPDHDGLVNVAEYAFGREPLIVEITNPLSFEADAGFFAVIYHRAKAATDVSIVVEANDEINSAWTSNVQPPIVTDDGNGVTETVRVRDAIPMNGAAHRFLRVRVIH